GVRVRGTPDAARTAPEELVHQFMTVFEAQWQKAAPAFRDRTAGRSRGVVALWRELMAETARHHYLDPSSCLGGPSAIRWITAPRRGRSSVPRSMGTWRTSRPVRLTPEADQRVHPPGPGRGLSDRGDTGACRGPHAPVRRVGRGRRTARPPLPRGPARAAAPR